jgi:hypothetical protein
MTGLNTSSRGGDIVINIGNITGHIYKPSEVFLIINISRNRASSSSETQRWINIIIINNTKLEHRHQWKQNETGASTVATTKTTTIVGTPTNRPFRPYVICPGITKSPRI